MSCPVGCEHNVGLCTGIGDDVRSDCACCGASISWSGFCLDCDDAGCDYPGPSREPCRAQMTPDEMDIGLTAAQIADTIRREESRG